MRPSSCTEQCTKAMAVIAVRGSCIVPLAKHQALVSYFMAGGNSATETRRNVFQMLSQVRHLNSAKKVLLQLVDQVSETLSSWAQLPLEDQHC